MFAAKPDYRLWFTDVYNVSLFTYRRGYSGLQSAVTTASRQVSAFALPLTNLT